VRGIIVRADKEEKELVPIVQDSCRASFLSLDASYVWIQSISDGILHELRNELSRDFFKSSDSKDVSASIYHAHECALLISSKYFGPVTQAENSKVRKAQQLCCRNIFLQIIPKILFELLPSKSDLQCCLASMCKSLCTSAAANASDKACIQAFESMILFADVASTQLSLSDIQHTILHEVELFIGKSILSSAILQIAFSKCSRLLWGSNCAASARLAEEQMGGKSFELVCWRGTSSNLLRSSKRTSPRRVDFSDFVTLRGPAFHRCELSGYFEVTVKEQCSHPHFGFCTAQFLQSDAQVSETEGSCGCDLNSW
jgi:hypothetical protein